jgi:hypothetical protein
MPYGDCGTTHEPRAASMQAVYMFRNFCSQVRSGVLNEEWPMSALKTQQVLDACLASAGSGGHPVDLRAESREPRAEWCGPNP